MIEGFQQGLGAFVWWSLRGVDVERDEMREAFKAVGLERAVPRDPQPRAVMTRACREALRSVTMHRFDRVREDGEVITSALSRCAKDAAAESVTWTQVAIIRLDVPSGTISTLVNDPTDIEAAQIVQRAKDLYAHVARYASSDDLRTALGHAMNGRRRDLLLGAVNVNGVHYVRREQLDRLGALATWVQTKSAGEITIVTVERTSENEAQIASGAQATILSRVRELQGEADHIAELVQLASEDELDRVLQPYLDRFELIRSSIELYSDVLGQVREDLLKSEREARAAITRRVLPVG